MLGEVSVRHEVDSGRPGNTQQLRRVARCSPLVFRDNHGFEAGPLYGLKGGSGDEWYLRFDAIRIRESRVLSFQVSVQLSDDVAFQSASLTRVQDTAFRAHSDATGRLLAEIDFGAVDPCDLARFDDDLPYESDRRLWGPRWQGCPATVEKVFPTLPVDLRKQLGRMGVAGNAVVYVSAQAFVRAITLTALPEASILLHGAFRLGLDPGPFESMSKAWSHDSVAAMVQNRLYEGAVYGNLQVQGGVGPDMIPGQLGQDCAEVVVGLAGGACYFHEVSARDAWQLLAGETVETSSLNCLTHIRRAVGSWAVAFNEVIPKAFIADPGVCMPGHRDCVGLCQCCLQVQGWKLLMADGAWEGTGEMTRVFGDPDQQHAESGSRHQGEVIPVDAPCTPAQLALVDALLERGAIGAMGPGDVAVFHASNFHAASNDASQASMALYVGWLPWAGMRRFVSPSSFWQSSDDYVPAGDLLEQRAFDAGLAVYRTVVKDVEWPWPVSSSEAEWLRARIQTVGDLVESAIAHGMPRLYQDAQKDLEVEAAELWTPGQQHDALISTGRPLDNSFSGDVIEPDPLREQSLLPVPEWAPANPQRYIQSLSLGLQMETVMDLFECASQRLEDHRQLDHAYRQLQVCEWVYHKVTGRIFGPALWSRASVLAMCVEIQMKRARVMGVGQLRELLPLEAHQFGC
mmetsp:Transcript_86459/g.231671  ORF Transcript_86459/g.231671 Transcript_86459/m.231671 type:complete len:686 (+) Transcript_86459:38-2095(+)